MIVIISILVFAAGTFFMYFGSSILKERKQTSEQQIKRPSALSQDRALYYLRLYCEVFKTQNLLSVVSIMSNQFYNKISNMINAYGRIGIRKEIELAPYPPEENAADDTTVYAQGYRDMSVNSTDFQVLERYVDTQTGRVLHERYKNKQSIITTLMRGTHRTEAEELHCLGCGNKVDTSGETFVCKFCGATYRADSFDWVMDGLQIGLGAILKTNKAARFALVLTLVGMAAVPLSVVALFVDFFVWLAILCNISYIAAVVFALVVERKVLKSMSPLEQYDPGESIMHLNSRFSNILERLAFAMDFNVSEAASDLDAPLYNYLATLTPRGDYHVLEASVFTGDFQYYHADNRQYLDAPVTLAFLLLTQDRQIAEISKTVNARFYRNINTRISVQNQMQNVTCSVCGFSLDLTAQGSCKYCGTQYDMADFDWKLASIDPSVFDYTGAKIIPPPTTLHPSITMSAQAQQAMQQAQQPTEQAYAGYAAPQQQAAQQQMPQATMQPQAAYAAGPPLENTAVVTPNIPLPIPLPQDDTPEQLYGILKCKFGKDKGSTQMHFNDEKLTEKGYTSEYCVCMVTNKRLTLIPFPKELSFDNDAYEPPASMAMDFNAALASFHISSIHSYALEKILVETTVHLYLYNDIVLKLEMPSKNFPQLKQLFDYFAPGLTQAPRSLMGVYYPSVSPNDPRNPYGYRYNPQHPRGYMVAHIKKLKKDPNAINDVIEFFRQDGTIPADFNLFVHGIGEYNPVLGVPMFAE